MALKQQGIYIHLSLSIGYFESYVNSKSDYIELLLSVYETIEPSKEPMTFPPFYLQYDKTTYDRCRCDNMLSLFNYIQWMS